VHPAEHGLSAVISQHSGEPLSITGPSPYSETTDALTAHAGLLETPAGWWGIVTHTQPQQHPQDTIAHYEPHLPPCVWMGPCATIGLYLLPTREKVVSTRINDSGVLQMISYLTPAMGKAKAESRFNRRRIPAGVRFLPGRHLQLWFSL
jgi:hypothetical protein